MSTIVQAQYFLPVARNQKATGLLWALGPWGLGYGNYHRLVDILVSGATPPYLLGGSVPEKIPTGEI